MTGSTLLFMFFLDVRVAGINVNAELGQFCAANAPMDAKNCQYFFHTSPDLAKTWITDNKGKPIALIVYLHIDYRFCRSKFTNKIFTRWGGVACGGCASY